MVTALALQLIQCVVKLPETTSQDEVLEEEEQPSVAYTSSGRKIQNQKKKAGKVMKHFNITNISEKGSWNSFFQVEYFCRYNFLNMQL